MDIFENQDKIINNMNESAKNLGIKEDVVKKTKRETRAFAKRNCKKCYGRGGLRHIAPNGKEDILQCGCVRLYEVQVPVDETSKDWTSSPY